MVFYATFVNINSVAIGRYCIYVWGLYFGLYIVRMGVRVLYVWATESGSKLP